MSTPRRETHRATRRDFLKGRAAADALGDLVPGGCAEGAEQHDLMTVSRRAMACDFAIYFSAGQRADDTDAALKALDLVDRLEDQLTIYRDTSELIEVNRLSGDVAVEVEPGLFGLLQLALRIHGETDGAFDITSGPLSQAWGFSRRSGRVPSREEIDAALGRLGSGDVQLDESRRTVRFLRPGIELNVNGIGKGYALDRGAAVLRESGMADFLFHGGQSSVVASGSDGTMSGKGSKRGWTVGLTHPMCPQQRVAEFYLRDRALGTSGSGTQFFHSAGRRYGHLLDPRTGWPAEGVHSATVLAPTAAEADALATAFYVLGPERAQAICERRPELAMAIVSPGSREGSIDIRTHGLANDDWQRL